MTITVWDIFKYIFKWKFFIIIVTVIAYLSASAYVEKKQTYTSKVIIQYLDSCIREGKTRDGKTFDSNEIKSPPVILNVLKELGYENKKIDSVRNNIVITPIIPKTVDNLKAAKEKMGEPYQYFPKTFQITYKGDSSYEATRDILNSVITNYFNYYADTYLYLVSLSEVDYNLNEKNFDYLEQAELIQDNVKQTIKALQGYEKDSASYRSPKTGMTFDNLLKEFERIEEYSISSIFSKIFEGQLTLDKKLLVDKYTERMEDNERQMNNALFKAQLAADRMEAYVNSDKEMAGAYQEKSSESDNENKIMSSVEKDKESLIDEQTTYDSLMTSYTNDSIAANKNKIDAEYCRSVLETFTKKADTSINHEEYENEVKAEIASVLSELKELYRLASINTADYNAFLPAHHIKKLSGVGYFENLSSSLYKLLALIGGFSISCAVAIAYEIMKKYAQFNELIKDKDDDDEAEENEG